MHTTSHRRLAPKAPVSAVRRRPGGLYAPELLESRIAPATFTVTLLTDPAVDTDGTLRHEIDLANAHAGPDTIVFQHGIGPGTIALTATLGITDTLTIKGPGVDVVSISGQDAHQIFHINDGTAAMKPSSISGLTLTNGKSLAGGGALYCTEPLTLQNVVVRSSNATGNGGGVWVFTDGKISITGSRIVHNGAANSGGIYLLGKAGVSVAKTTIADNTAFSAGGLYAGTGTAKATVLIDTCIVANNSATVSDGGGLTLDSDGGGKVILKNSLVTGNSAADGGGLALSNGANFLISGTTFSNNTASNGGAIGGTDAVSLTISGSRFLANSATSANFGGGALYLKGATVTKITGSLFSGNSSANFGGAIYDQNTLATTISSSSFLGNTATANGGAIFAADGTALTLKSSILSGNISQDHGGALSASSGTVLTLTGNKFTENHAVYGGGLFLHGSPGKIGTAQLSGNLFQANLALKNGGGVYAEVDTSFTSKADRFVGDVARTGQGGGVFLKSADGLFITGALVQDNVAASSGGGLLIAGDATLTGLKVIDNIAGAGGRGGGIRIGAGTTVSVLKSFVTGNVANDGGGIFFDLGTATITGTVVRGNTAFFSPNIGSA